MASKDQPIGIIRAELNAAEVGKNAVCGELSICLQFADSAVNRSHPLISITSIACYPDR